MKHQLFDEHADAYDSWFMENVAILQSELLLLRHALGEPGEALSVGCGTGLFERNLREQFGVAITEGVEPSEAMAAIARKRGMNVVIGSAEELPIEDGRFDTVILNGVPSYVADLPRAFREAHRVLKPGGTIVVLDVPAEGSYGLLYRLAGAWGSWDDPRLKGVAPACPYPLELAAGANWRTTQEKLDTLTEVGFTGFETSQTLTRHPHYSNDSAEEPSQGHDRGDYVAIRASKG